MSKGKDKRYKTVKILIEAGHVKALSQVFDTIPRSIVAKDFGTNYVRFSRLISNVEQFALKEVYTLAKLFEVSEEEMLRLVHNLYIIKSKGNKKIN